MTATPSPHRGPREAPAPPAGPWILPTPAHAPTRVLQHVERDLRSVGELLVDADYLARQLLFDVDARDAAGLLRQWPAVAQGCLGVWTALHPQRAPMSPAPPSALTRSERTMTRGLESWPWPGAVPADGRLQTIADQLDRAADLITRLSGDIPYGRRDVEADAASARSRATHTVYVTTHAIIVALRQHERELHQRLASERRASQVSPDGTLHQLARTARWLATLDRVERRIGDLLTGRTLAGSSTTSPPADHHRQTFDLHRHVEALGAWEEQARAILTARSPRPADLALVSSTQAFIGDAVGFLLTTATSPDFARTAPAGVVDVLVRPRTPDLIAAVADSARTWRALARHWSGLVPGAPRHDPALADAAGQTRAALRALTHDGGSAAPTAVLAQRVGVDLVALIGHALDDGAELVQHASDPARNDALRGPARQLSVLAHNLTDAGLAQSAAPKDDVPWVELRDVAQNRQVPIPDPVSHWRAAAGHAAAASAHRADQICHDGLISDPCDRGTTRSAEPAAAASTGSNGRASIAVVPVTLQPTGPSR